jgi:5-methylcytosine-specific restriction endonuclease McrA
LELQFKGGMNWNNYGRGGWVLDHKIPKSLFNIKGIKSKGFKKCWALENLQPMWEKDNRSKSDTLFY